MDYFKAYIGYHGKASVNSKTSDVEFRYGTQVVVRKAYITPGVGQESMTYDMAVIKLHFRFTDVKPIKYRATPLVGTEELGVIGFHSDRDECGEKAARMYEQFKRDQILDLKQSESSMLHYTISTCGGLCFMVDVLTSLAYLLKFVVGQSGGLVLRCKDGRFESIGVHQGRDVEHNRAAPIAGALVNPIRSFLDAIDNTESEIAELDKCVDLMRVDHIPEVSQGLNGGPIRGDSLTTKFRLLLREVQEMGDEITHSRILDQANMISDTRRKMVDSEFTRLSSAARNISFMTTSIGWADDGAVSAAGHKAVPDLSLLVSGASSLDEPHVYTRSRKKSSAVLAERDRGAPELAHHSLQGQLPHLVACSAEPSLPKQCARDLVATIQQNHSKASRYLKGCAALLFARFAKCPG